MSTELKWFKSSYSSSGGGECLEAALTPRTTHIRDSKLGTRSPRLAVPVEAWTALVAYAQSTLRHPHA